MILIILPHQLYNFNKYVKKEIEKYNIKQIILWEHPQYFTKYDYNKKKLILHRSSMKLYYDTIIKIFKNIKYIEFNQQLTFNFNEKYVIFDPIDKIELLKPINKLKLTIIESPNFLLTKKDYQDYRNKTDKFFFNSFYMFGKGKNYVNIIPNIKSQDKNNRRIPSKNMKYPNLPKPYTKKEEKYVNEAIKYIDKHFNKNMGTTNNFCYPISHQTANKWLINFLKNRLKEFGPYQDYISKDQHFMFHSILSSSINIGLLNPSEIIKKIRNYKSKVPLNSYEGYIRQLFWREYQRYVYIYLKDLDKMNYFGNNKKLNKFWYSDKKDVTGYPPVDKAIEMTYNTGYLHHIQRLMVVGNFMSLNGITYKEAKKWFITFIDGYDYLMYQNIDMILFLSGGKTMRKPYMTSSNYIIKMSDYGKGEWSENWNKMYNDFLKKHKTKLWKFRYSFPTLKKL